MTHPKKRIKNLSPEEIIKLFLNDYRQKINSPEAHEFLKAFADQIQALNPDDAKEAQTLRDALQNLIAIQPANAFREDEPDAEGIALSPVSGICITQDGQFFVADDFNHRVQVYDSSFNLTRQFGGKGKEPGEFMYPKGLTVDSEGNLFVTDSWNHRVQKFSPDGKHLLTFGSYGEGKGQLNEPYDVHVDANGTVIVVERYNHRIQFFNPVGTSLGWIGQRATVQEERLARIYETSLDLMSEPVFEFPTSIALDSYGNYYISDSGNHRVLKFDPAWNPIDTFGERGEGPGCFQYCMSIAIGANDLLYATDLNNDRVQVWTTEGVPLYSFTTGIDNTELRMPAVATTDGAGKLWLGLSFDTRLFSFEPPTLSANEVYDQALIIEPDNPHLQTGKALRSIKDNKEEDANQAAWRTLESINSPADNIDRLIAKLPEIFREVLSTQNAQAGGDLVVRAFKRLDEHIAHLQDTLLDQHTKGAERLPEILGPELEEQNAVLENRQNPQAFNKNLYQAKKADKELFQQSRIDAHRHLKASLIKSECVRILIQPETPDEILKGCLGVLMAGYQRITDRLTQLLTEKEAREENLVQVLQDNQDPNQWLDFLTKNTLNNRVMDLVRHLQVEFLAGARNFSHAMRSLADHAQGRELTEKLTGGGTESLRFPRVMMSLQENDNRHYDLDCIFYHLMQFSNDRQGDTQTVATSMDSFAPYAFDSDAFRPEDLLEARMTEVRPPRVEGEALESASQRYSLKLTDEQARSLLEYVTEGLEYLSTYENKTHELYKQAEELFIQKPDMECRLMTVDVRDKRTPLQIHNNITLVDFQINLLYRMIHTLEINEATQLKRLVTGSALLFASECGKALEGISEFKERVKNTLAVCQERIRQTAERKKESGLKKSTLEAEYLSVSSSMEVNQLSKIREIKIEITRSNLAYYGARAELTRNSRLAAGLSNALKAGGELQSSGGQTLSCVDTWGTPGRAPDSIRFPFGLTHSPDGTLFVSSYTDHRILRISSSGQYLGEFSRRGNGPGLINGAYGIVADSIGHVYVADNRNRRVQKFQTDGSFIMSIGDTGEATQLLSPMVTLAVDSRNNLWVPDTENHCVKVYSDSGELVKRFGETGTRPEDMFFPLAVCCLEDGTVLVSDRSDHRLKKFDSEGKLLATLNQESIKAGEVYSIVQHPRLGFFLADTYNLQIIRVDNDLNPVAVYSQPGKGPGQTLQIGEMSLFGERLFVSDYLNCRVQVFDLSGLE